MTQAKCIRFPEPELIFSPDETCTSPFPLSGLRVQGRGRCRTPGEQDRGEGRLRILPRVSRREPG